MSRIGRKVLPLPKGVTLAQKAGSVSVKGPKGELTKAIPTGVTIKTEADKITVLRADDERTNRAKHGLMRAHLANMVKGVTCLLYTSPSPRDRQKSRMPSSA